VHDQSYAVLAEGEFPVGAGGEGITSAVLDKQISKINGLLNQSSNSVTVIAGAGGGVLVLLVLTFVIRKRRAIRRSRVTGSLRSAPSVVKIEAPVLVGASVSVASAGVASIATPEPTSSYFCSWCGVERQAGALAMHHCGSRQRPSAYCSTCGETLSGEVCSCGTPATQLSPK
jgi:hypothetical protein